MNPADEAAAYLEKLLEERGLDMQAVSYALDRNPTYIQQYFSRRVPQWLKEKDRKALAALIEGLDESRLVEPGKAIKPIRQSKRGRPKRKNEAQIDPPGDGQVMDDPRTTQLLEVWRAITDPGMRDLALNILREMSARK